MGKQRTKYNQSNSRLFSVLMIILAVSSVVIGINLFGGAETPPVIQIPAPETQTNSAEPLGVLSSSNQAGPLVGIVSGHRGYDPGAVCDDGLTEADVNYIVAREVVDLLTRRGVPADLLDEYDDRLSDYQAAALISVHADSCNIPGATGFKTARVTDSAIPEAEDKLVACLNREYALHTNLTQHPSSITDGMTDYHAFNQIHPHTPGAIIEMGFLLDDRALLTERPKIVARGIAAGILCFLEE